LLRNALELQQGPFQQQSQLVVVASHGQLQAAAGQLHIVLKTCDYDSDTALEDIQCMH